MDCREVAQYRQTSGKRCKISSGKKYLISNLTKLNYIIICFRTIRLLFKRLRLLYEKCDNPDDYIQVESLIPFVDEDNKPDTVPVHSEEYQRTLVENRELTEILAQKNLQLKEIIDNMRSIIWEINSMMAARKS